MNREDAAVATYCGHASIHKSPRKNMEKLPLHKKGMSLRRSRLSILVGEDAEDLYIVGETPEDAAASAAKKMLFMRKGLVVSYQAMQKTVIVVYKQTPLGVTKAKLRPNSVDFIVQEIAMMERDSRLRESFYLRMKQNGKEFNPKHFDKADKGSL